MANTFFSVQYLTLSQAPIKESKTQFPGSTGIYLFRDYLSAFHQSASSQCSGTNVFQKKETPRLLGVKGKVKPKQGTLAPGPGLPPTGHLHCLKPAAL